MLKNIFLSLLLMFSFPAAYAENDWCDPRYCCPPKE
jgi:hypothetical protein